MRNVRLCDAAHPSLTLNAPGVYIIRLNGQIMKVGSAEIGIQKRMQQYYGMNSACGLNLYINAQNRDAVTVDYQYCDKQDCRELESKLFDKYGPIEVLPWAERRPYSTSNNAVLLI